LVACLEEIAFQSGWLDESALREAANKMGANAYSQYLMRLLSSRSILDNNTVSGIVKAD